MAARKLSPVDVIEAIKAQNIQVAAGKIGQPPVPKGQQFEFKLESNGRLADPKEFEDIVIKAGADKAGNIRLKDVGRVELGAAVVDDFVSLNGRPGVVLGVYPNGAANPKDVSRTVADKIAKLAAKAPDGLRLEVAFDFTENLEHPRQPMTAEYLLLDLEFPDGTSLDRKLGSLERGERLLREIEGVQDVLSLTASPFDILNYQPCILVRLAAADKRKISQKEIMETISAKFKNVPDARMRVRDLSRAGAFPKCGYPIDLAICDSGNEGAGKLREVAEKFAERLQKSKKLTDAAVNPESAPRPWLFVDIDRTKAQTLGVAPKDIFDTLQIYFGSMYVNDFNRFGRIWQVTLQVDEKSRKEVEKFKLLQIRNKEGQMVPLGTVATLKTVAGPAAIHHLDMLPMVQITANPAADVSLSESRKLCEILFKQMRKESRLSAEYRLIWLQEIPLAK